MIGRARAFGCFEDVSEHLRDIGFGAGRGGNHLDYQRCRGVEEMGFPGERIEGDGVAVEIDEPQIRDGLYSQLDQVSRSREKLPRGASAVPR